MMPAPVTCGTFFQDARPCTCHAASMHRTIPSGIVDLFTQQLQFGSGGTIRVDELHTPADHADWRLAIIPVETADDAHPGHWERHPLADEAVCCVEGAIRLYLRAAQPGTPDDL